jgi:hypothetical protein
MNVSDLLNMDIKKKVVKDERFKKYYEQLNDEQKEHIGTFIDDLKAAFMPSIESFGTALNEMTPEQREEFNENLKKLNT